jgi:hypothetical protein
MRHRSEFQSLGGAVAPGAKRAAAHATLARLRVYHAFRRAVGNGLEKVASPDFYDDGRLGVRLLDPRWLPELRRLEDEILKRMREDLAENAVRRIVFQATPRRP